MAVVHRLPIFDDCLALLHIFQSVGALREAAFGYLYARYQPLLIWFVSRWLHRGADDPDVVDILQTTWERFLESGARAEEGVPDSPPRRCSPTWVRNLLLVIARRLLIDAWRRTRHVRVDSTLPPGQTLEQVPERDSQKPVTNDLRQRWLARLREEDPDMLMVVLLREAANDLTFEQLSVLVGLPVATVRKHLDRALVIFREIAAC